MGNKTLNNVKVNVKFTEAKTRENLSSSENLSTGFGKISKWFSDLNDVAFNGYPLSNGNSTAGIIKTSSTVTSTTGLTACPVISGVPYYKNTTYTNMKAATASAAGTAGLVPAPAAGKQTSFLRGDGTWAAPTNTDTFVKQSASITDNFRPVLLGYNNSTDVNSIDAEVTNQAYSSKKIYTKPSAGSLYATGGYYAKSGALFSTTNGVPDSLDSIPIICHNSTNLWIGANSTTSPHHTGNTYISTGYNVTSGKGYDSIYLSVPNDDNTSATNYCVLSENNYSKYVKKKQRIIVGYSGVYNTGNNSWFKIASCKLPANKNINTNLVFLVTDGYAHHGVGLLLVAIRQNDIGSISPVMRWIMETNLVIDPNDFIVAHDEGNTTGGNIEIWVHSDVSYSMYHFDLIQEFTRTDWEDSPIFQNNPWIFYNKPTAQANPTSGYKQVVSVKGSSNIPVNGYLPLTGGIMTGKITYNSGRRTSDLFRITDGDAAGAMLSLGHTGGLTIIGGGESASNIDMAAKSTDGILFDDYGPYSPTSEQMIVSSDKSIFFTTNCQNIENKKSVILDEALKFAPTLDKTGSLGSTLHKWNDVNAYSLCIGKAGKNNTPAVQFTEAGVLVGERPDSVVYSSTVEGYVCMVKMKIAGTYANIPISIEIGRKSDVITTTLYLTFNSSSTTTTTVKSFTYHGININAYICKSSATEWELWVQKSQKDDCTTIYSIKSSAYANDRIIITRPSETDYLTTADFTTAIASGGKFATNKKATVNTTLNTNNNVTVNSLTVTPSANNALVRPLLFAASNANPSNTINSTTALSGPEQSVATTYTGSVNMTTGAYIKTNYYTTGGDAYGYTTICADSFKTLGNQGSFIGRLTGNADTATRLSTARNINGVAFNGEKNISLTKLLYSGTGSASVTLTESSANYDAFIIKTNLGTFFKIGTGYSQHTYTRYPVPAQNGSNTVLCGNISTYINEKSFIGALSKYELSGTSSGASTVSTSITLSIQSVYGLKLS